MKPSPSISRESSSSFSRGPSPSFSIEPETSFPYTVDFIIFQFWKRSLLFKQILFWSTKSHRIVISFLLTIITTDLPTLPFLIYFSSKFLTGIWSFEAFLFIRRIANWLNRALKTTFLKVRIYRITQYQWYIPQDKKKLILSYIKKGHLLFLAASTWGQAVSN